MLESWIIGFWNVRLWNFGFWVSTEEWCNMAKVYNGTRAKGLKSKRPHFRPFNIHPWRGNDFRPWVVEGMSILHEFFRRTLSRSFREKKALNMRSQVTHNPQWWCASRQSWFEKNTKLGYWLWTVSRDPQSRTRKNYPPNYCKDILKSYRQEMFTVCPPSRCPTVQASFGGPCARWWSPHPIFAPLNPPLKMLTKPKQTFSRWCFQRIWKRLVKMWFFLKEGWKQKTLETTTEFGFAFWRRLRPNAGSISSKSGDARPQSMRGSFNWGVFHG